MRHLLKNNNMHIVINDSCSTIPHMEEKNKQYTSQNVKIAYWKRWSHHITGKPIRLILHTNDNNILQNLLILREEVGMAEDIYGPSVPHLHGKKVRHKFNMWNLSWYQMYPRKSLINTRKSPYAVIHTYQRHWLTEHHISTHYVCHRNYS